MNITEKKDPDRIPTRQEKIDKVFKTFEEVHWNIRQAEAEWIGGDNASALSLLYDTENVIDALRTRIKWGID